MSHSDLNEKNALKAAIEMEELGFSFFKDSASKSKDSFAREVFEFLAGEELNHIKAIEKFNESVLSGHTKDPSDLIKDIKNGSAISAIRHLFEQLSSKSPISGTENDVYRFAMDFERKGEAFYTKAEAEAKDPNAKKLFAFLVGEERRHFKIVESCLAYFENPGEFFHQREKWHLEG